MDRALLERFIKGTCTPEEMEAVKQWLEAEPGQLEAFLREAWEEDITDPMPASMEQALLQELPARDEGPVAPGVFSTDQYMQPSRNADRMAPGGVVRGIRTGRRVIWAAAAAVLLLVMAGWWGWQMNRRPGQQLAHQLLISAPAGQTLRYVLPDSSVVWLKEQTRIQIDTVLFGQQERNVELLEGTVFADVRQDPARPFTLESGAVRTRVLGTSFSVQRNAASADVLVTVATGKVAVSHEGKELDVLLPGRQIAVNAGSGQFSEQEVPLWMAAAWKEQELQLEHASFTELLSALRQLYGIRLETGSSKARRQMYNIKLNRQTPVKEVLDVLTLLNGQTYKQVNDTTYMIY